ncbi:DEAD/DEAH box helicase [Acidisphaera sp. L21]|uniref:DEAD/DEAH box helicase n=1 Tax=Acidisphaera sp. L21 TaxID=1641851 RepID=UPI00131D781B|nr:DEAD/DEAH box helicase [Acidisphaera sp. L21]
MPFPPIHPVLDAALAARGYDEPTAVQSAVLEPEAEGRDLLVSARTGSGKTVAFGLAAAPTLMPGGELPRPGTPIALAIAPTRELALQVQAELAWLYAGARIAACVGGMDIRREARALAAGCHIVVGTPGRLGDHLRRGNLDLSGLKVVVLDEADEMLDLGFQEELEFILSAAPADRRTLLFSATIPHDIAALARRYQRDALRIDTIDRTQQHTDIEYRAISVASHEAGAALINLLRWYDAPRALVFCATREGTKRLHMALVERGFAAVMLSGELSQHDRTAALDSMRAGRARVGVCTDVAARGLDLPELDLVVHADLPTNPETLLHRSGRTGRAGRKGVSALIVPHPKRRRAEQVLNAARLKAAWSGAPSADEIRARDRERLSDDPMFEMPTGTERTEAEALLSSHDAIAVAAALLRLHRARLPPPEEITRELPQAVRAPATYAGHADAAPRGPRPTITPGDFVQFRVAVGRNEKADPKWLIPLICRMGGVTKKEIGAIRVFDTDTRFEITRDASAAFAAATLESTAGEPRITPAGDGPMPVRAPQKPYRGKSNVDTKARPRRHG